MYQVPSIDQYNALMQRVEALEKAAKPPPTPEPPADDSRTHIIGSHAEWQQTTQQAGHTYVLSYERHPGPVEVTADDVTIKAFPGVNVIATAFKPITATPRIESGVYIIPYTHGLYRHPATKEGPWQGHRDRMRPEQFVVNGKLLKPVYSRSDLKSGTFYVDGQSSRPESVFLIPHEGPMQSVSYAHHDRLCYGDAKGVSIEGITFEGAASTGKRGAFLTGDGWQVKNCNVRFSAGPGFEITGKDVIVEDCLSELNGQLNYLTRQYEDLHFIGCTSRKGNRKGFNAAWEAGGTKIVNDWKKGGVNITVKDYLSEDDNGPGLWFDINNRGAIVDGVTVRNALAAGVMFEFGFYDGSAKNIRVEGVRPYSVPEKFYSRQDGIVWQAAVHDSVFDTMHAEGCNKAFVFKVHEGRGASLRNRLTNLSASDVRESWYMEQMSMQQILSAIRDGSNPKTHQEWQNHGNHIEQVKQL